MEGLIWAKQCIIDFEKFLKVQTYYLPASIIVQWTDSRRKRVYTRTLSKLGFRLCNKYGWCLCKEINDN